MGSSNSTERRQRQSDAIIYQDEEDNNTTLCSNYVLPSWLMSKKQGPLLKLLHDDDSSTATTTPTTLSCATSLSFRSNHDDDEDDEGYVGTPDSSSSCVPKVEGMSYSSSWSSNDSSSSSSFDYYTREELDMVDGDLPTIQSDMRPSKHTVRTFHVVTTAALPWQTGTAVNPLLRAAHLSRLNRPYTNKSTVTLVVPWLESSDDRVYLYGEEWRDKTKKDQDEYIREWLVYKAELALEANLSTGGIQIQFYNARWHKGMNSIFAMGDIESCIPDDEADICILEEPEHLNFYRAPSKEWWTEKFTHVVGIGHTNYKAYVREQFYLMSPVVGVLSSWMVRAYCHKLIKLSDVLQTYAPEKEVTVNVHGIRNDFLDIGRHQHEELKGIYFIGKLLWAKGFDRMIELQVHYRKVTGHYFDLDIVGSGPDQSEIERAFFGKGQPSPKKKNATTAVGSQEQEQTSSSQQQQQQQQSQQLRIPKSRYEFRKEAIPVQFRGRADHAECYKYKIFVNPSLTEVLCTTTAEAIAMNKFVLVPAHPSNAFFRQFPNCLQYHNKAEFVTLLQYALSHKPQPLSPELQHVLTWEAATERCIMAAAISRRDAARLERVGKDKADAKIAKLHYEIGKGVKGDVIRKVLGGGPVSDQVQYEKQTVMIQQGQTVAAAC